MEADWKDELSLNIEAVDKQHQKLFFMVNVLKEHMESGETHQVMKNYLDELIHYTEIHFSDEEKFMREHGVKKKFIDGHAQEHQGLLHQITAFRNEFEKDQKVFTPEMIRFLLEWLRNHIVNTDRKIPELLKPE